MENTISSHGWIGVDLDGTLAHYTEWRGPEHIGEPIPAMVERVRRWLADGRDVRIFTARVACDGWERVKRVRAIAAWCRVHLGQELEVTCTKDMHMIELWDDRAVSVQSNTGVQLSPSTRGLGLALAELDKLAHQRVTLAAWIDDGSSAMDGTMPGGNGQPWWKCAEPEQPDALDLLTERVEYLERTVLALRKHNAGIGPEVDGRRCGRCESFEAGGCSRWGIPVSENEHCYVGVMRDDVHVIETWRHDDHGRLIERRVEIVGDAPSDPPATLNE